MPRSKFLAASTVFLVLAGCSHAPTKSGRSEWTVEVGPRTLAFKEFRPSIPGRILFPAGTGTRNVSTLNSIDTNGKLNVLRVAENRYRGIAFMELRPIEPGIYAYVTSVPGDFQYSMATLNFVNDKGHDVFLRPLPLETAGLNYHDFAINERGNYLLLFSGFDYKSQMTESTIQEWDMKGRAIANVRLNDHLKDLLLPGETSNFMVNSIDTDANGDIWIGLMQLNQIAKLSGKSGKVLARVVAPEWKFVDDPFGGFRFPHGANILPNGNLLLLDMGGTNSEHRPRAVEYALDETTKTAKLVWSYQIPDIENPPRTIGGSVQRLSNGNTFIGWGTPKTFVPTPNMLIATEAGADGKVVRELRGQLISFKVWFEETPVQSPTQ